MSQSFARIGSPSLVIIYKFYKQGVKQIWDLAHLNRDLERESHFR